MTRRQRAASPAQCYGASNAYLLTVVDYAPEPAPAVQGLMDDIAIRLQGRRGGTYPPGPGTPETSFCGYAPAAPTSIVRTAQGGLGGRGLVYPDANLNTMASGLSGGPYADTARQMFAERLRRRGTVL